MHEWIGALLQEQSDVIHLAAQSGICNQSERLLSLGYMLILSTIPEHYVADE
jgi:hypothetical protein